MSRDDAYLIDILESARLALSYVSGMSSEEFFEDIRSQDAVIRRLEIIGEAARRVSEGRRAALPLLPWSLMIGMRNVMIHDYDHVNLATVWDTVRNDLPPLIAALEAELQDYDTAQR